MWTFKATTPFDWDPEVRTGENGFVFRAGDANQLAESMRKYLDTPTLCETHGSASRQRAADWLLGLGPGL